MMEFKFSLMICFIDFFVVVRLICMGMEMCRRFFVYVGRNGSVVLILFGSLFCCMIFVGLFFVGLLFVDD